MILFDIRKLIDLYCHFRERIGTNINYNGVDTWGRLLLHQKNSFIYLADKRLIESLRISIVMQKRDFDILEQSLGIYYFSIIKKVFAAFILTNYWAWAFRCR